MTLLTDPQAPGAGEDLAGNEKGRQMTDDIGKRGGPAHQVVLVTAVGRALVVGVVLIQQDPLATRRSGRSIGGPIHDIHTGPVPQNGVAGVRHLGR